MQAGGWRCSLLVTERIEPVSGKEIRVFDNMNKKEIKSGWLTANFVFWFCGVGCVLLLLFLGHYVWKVF